MELESSFIVVSSVEETVDGDIVGASSTALTMIVSVPVSVAVPSDTV